VCVTSIWHHLGDSMRTDAAWCALCCAQPQAFASMELEAAAELAER
jgi:hypothetical protein